VQILISLDGDDDAPKDGTRRHGPWGFFGPHLKEEAFKKSSYQENLKDE